MADIGTRNETLMKQAIQDSEFAKDDRYDDNPYAIGNSLQNVNPENGQTYPETLSWDGINIPNEIQLASTSTHLISASTVTTTNAPVNSFVAQSGPSRSQRGGGRGHNHFHNQNRGGQHNTTPYHRSQYGRSNNVSYQAPPYMAQAPTYQSYQQSPHPNPNYFGTSYNANHRPNFQNRNSAPFLNFPMIDPSLAAKPAIGYGSYVAP